MTRKSKTTRNESIFRRYQAGAFGGALAAEFGITRARVYQVLRLVSEKSGVPLRGRLNIGPPRKDVPLPLLESVARGELSVFKAAEQAEVSYCTIHKRMMEHKLKPPAYRRPNDVARGAEIYRRFIEGETLRELADAYGTTTGAISLRLHRHRRRTGAPGKRASRQAEGAAS